MKPKRTRAPRKTKAQAEEEATTTSASEPVEKKTRARRTTKKSAAALEPLKMYVLKFNSPILPYSKFPLTHNKYIQEFIKMYEVDKDKVDRIIGVHFPQNNNSLHKGTVGIEINISKKNSMTMIESVSPKRFRVLEYDPETNFCQAEPFEDTPLSEAFGMDKSSTGVELNQKDLLASELFELKNLWFVYNKKINQLLMILPAEVVNRYDMVIKSLQPPIFDITKYP